MFGVVQKFWSVVTSKRRIGPKICFWRRIGDSSAEFSYGVTRGSELRFQVFYE